MLFTRHARTLLAWLGLVFFSIWLPVAVVAWVPGWHEASCDWHDRCAQYGLDDARDRISELRGFLQWRNELDATRWTEKERTHLAEVRSILGTFSVLALLGALVFIHTDPMQRARTARWAMLLAAVCVIVLPFFGSFWRDIFHPLLFRNTLWLNEPTDTSWWIMPRIYFHYTTALVIGVATLFCALVRTQAMRQLNP